MATGMRARGSELLVAQTGKGVERLVDGVLKCSDQCARLARHEGSSSPRSNSPPARHCTEEQRPASRSERGAAVRRRYAINSDGLFTLRMSNDRISILR